MHKEMRNVGFILLRNGGVNSFCENGGQGSKILETQLSRKFKNQNKQNVNEIEFSLITTILLTYYINVRQIKVSEITTQS